MHVHLIISHKKYANYHQAYKIDDPVVSIGRDVSNRIILEDRTRTVSRQHAEVRRDGENYLIVDKGSRRGTYVNDYKISPEQPFRLGHGTNISIGDYVLTVSMQKEDDSAIFSALIKGATNFLNNPFFQEVTELSAVLSKIQEKCGRGDIDRQSKLLREALSEMMNSQTKRDFYKIVGTALNGTVESDKSIESVKITEITRTNKKPDTIEGNETERQSQHRTEKTITTDEPLKPDTLPENSSPAEISNRADDLKNLDLTDVKADQPDSPEPVKPAEGSGIKDEVINLFFNHLINCNKITEKFKKETRRDGEPDKSDNLHDNSIDELLRYFAGPEIDDSERIQRLKILREKLDKIYAHQTAVVSGYEISIKEGMQAMMKEMNPVTLGSAIKRKKYKIGKWRFSPSIIPFYVKIEAYLAMRKKYYCLVAESRGQAVEKYFKPVLSRIYLENIEKEKNGF